MGKKVFVVHEPLRRNAETGHSYRYLDLSSAEKFGELVFLAPRGEFQDDELQKNIRKMHEIIDAEYRTGDYLLPLGHPAYIAAASSILSKKTGGDLNLLVWRGYSFGYSPICFNTRRNQNKIVNPS